jgi:hypothetical protein
LAFEDSAFYTPEVTYFAKLLVTFEVDAAAGFLAEMLLIRNRYIGQIASSELSLLRRTSDIYPSNSTTGLSIGNKH